ncbi:MAG: SDR family NAD(P)-dependent oxidoreductase [Sedimentisphaerales bacterium]|nr:SDR family NAD(P)-dependent oxidoreductase [Sedimentisphaerales bacterium]
MQRNEQPAKLANITPIVRGLLAEPTDSPDTPFAPVILKTIATEEAIDFAASPEKADAADYPLGLAKTDTPPLFVPAIEPDAHTEQIRGKIAKAIADFTARHSAKPSAVCLEGLAILHVPARDNPSLPLANKVALVTGAAGAIGYGICAGLLEKGCRVAATDLPGQKLDQFAADLDKIAGNRAIAVPIDVTDHKSIADGFDRVVANWGGIDIVVINAGIAMVAKLKDMDLEQFRKLETVNVEGALLTLKQTAKHLTLQAAGGDIIVISTKNVPAPGAGFGAYSATKAACHQLGRIASLELAQFGIRVNMVAPDAVFAEGKYKSGLWATVGPDRMKARGLDEEALAEYYRNRNLLKIQITGRHVANAVLFFATRQVPATGITIPVDGGLPDATPR